MVRIVAMNFKCMCTHRLCERVRSKRQGWKEMDFGLGVRGLEATPRVWMCG